MMTVLTLIQNFTDKMNLPTPSAVVGSQEKSVRQYRSLLRELIQDLSEYSWQEQILRKTWLSLPGQDQGPLLTIFGPGYSGIIADTLWNDDRKMRIYGPVPESIWQALQTLPNAGPEFQCWISGGRFYVSPALNLDENLSAIYKTSLSVLDVDGVTTKEFITADNDSLLFPDSTVLKGFEAKWRKQKGEAGWEDDYNDYMGLIAKNLVKDGAPRLSMDFQPNKGARPGIVIPAGSWNV